MDDRTKPVMKVKIHEGNPVIAPRVPIPSCYVGPVVSRFPWHHTCKRPVVDARCGSSRSFARYAERANVKEAHTTAKAIAMWTNNKDGADQ